MLGHSLEMGCVSKICKRLSPVFGTTSMDFFRLPSALNPMNRSALRNDFKQNSTPPGFGILKNRMSGWSSLTRSKFVNWFKFSGGSYQKREYIKYKIKADKSLTNCTQERSKA